MRPATSGRTGSPTTPGGAFPACIYLVIAAACVVVWLVWHDSSPIANAGWLWAAGLLTVAGVISITSGWRMHVDERAALVAAQSAVGFPVGHASAQQVWRGLRSRPTWRVLCYSVEDPPVRRGLVLVDAIDGRVIEQPRRGQPRALVGRAAGVDAGRAELTCASPSAPTRSRP